MQNAKLLIITLVVTFFGIVGVGYLLSMAMQPAETVSEVEVTQLTDGARHVTGATESASLTIVEFSDFQCPACASVAPALKAILAQYPEQAELVYRHFPLRSIHPNAVPAAKASEAAAAQGAFWEMHDALFQRQQEWSNESNPRALFLGYAEDLGLNLEQFEQTYDAAETEEAVFADLRVAEQLGLNSTPTLFLNGKKVSLNELNQAISVELQKQ